MKDVDVCGIVALSIEGPAPLVTFVCCVTDDSFIDYQNLDLDI